MRALIFACLSVALISPAAADDCAVDVGKIVSNVPGTMYVGRLDISVELRNAEAQTFYVMCDKRLQLRIKSASPYPSARFYDVVARAAHTVSGEPSGAILQGAKECAQSALKEPPPSVPWSDARDFDVETKRTFISCSVAPKTGGAYFMIDIKK